ncbi:tripartite tricarboxylate transporter permease [Paracoccus sp. PAR01]|uniref:tripartite tricarboxylate transporter permease n=1 Tax=Paracoccus sp. PAR01 TaxID=2769282 RepID=UPI0017859B40|nr:tripartite tricarboxylate transporter permease [Paracoccus sp. PAR01]MBD9529274.1 tripartite tricarboxylate transporter permease [Paracoccus sp. PAR01]
MQTLDFLLAGFQAAFQIGAFLTIVVGLLIGVIAGALPGISFVNAMAMALPFTYAMDVTHAMLFLGGIYVGGVFGGSISAIMINVPGTPASLPSTWDGYAMTKRGQVKRALTIAVTASATGGLVSALMLTFLSAPFASFAMKFSQPEFFAATVLGLVSVIAIAKDRPIITMISLLIGVAIGTVGVDPLYGQARFSFGVPEVESGIRFVVVMIGLFAIGEVVDLVSTDRDLRPKKPQGKASGASFRDILNLKGPILRGTGIGCMIGVIPGAGATPGAVIAYGIEKQVNPRGSEFGTGVEAGLAAPEAAKNATTGAAMVPLLTLGIPGSAATAIMLAAMMLQGVNPGPLLFVMDPSMVYTIFAAMIIANVLMIGAGVGVAQMFSTLMRTPPAILAGFIVVLSLIGAFGVRNNIFDVYVCLAFGVVGWAMKRVGFPSAPLVLGVILGPLAERYFLTAVANSHQDFTVFFTRPISATILLLALVFVLWSLWPSVKSLVGRRSVQEAGLDSN